MSEENTLKIPKLVSAYDIGMAINFFKEQYEEKIREFELIAKKQSNAHEVRILFKENEVIFQYCVRVDMLGHYKYGDNIHYRMENGKIIYNGDIEEYDGQKYEKIPNLKAAMLFQEIAVDVLKENEKFYKIFKIIETNKNLESLNGNLKLGVFYNQFYPKYNIYKNRVVYNSVDVLNKYYKREEEFLKNIYFPAVPELYDFIELYEQKKNEKSNMIDKVKKLFRY